jgi:hypothetical protein
METYLPTLTVAGVLGFLAPLLSTALSKLTWSSQVKQLVALAVAAFMAVIALLVTNGFRSPNPDESPVVYWLTTLLAVVAVAQLAYQLIYKNPSLGSVNDKVALATSSEAERQKYIAQNTIKGEVVPEDKSGVPDTIVENTVTGEDEIDRTPPGPDYTPRHNAGPTVG